jgi:hypothetical protein
MKDLTGTESATDRCIHNDNKGASIGFTWRLTTAAGGRLALKVRERTHGIRTPSKPIVE